VETIFKLCEHLAGNADRYVEKTFNQDPTKAAYQIVC
jgi:hypothetical protein